ncbi:MAPEG family protein [Jiella sp. MQZ9-1]|uniref:MAPEG family protein n=1 Tax=Jiella flava TaxID=2816857 RepID=A0A939JTY4_9HYPH|nr:MAPEG family protein [Jiella flava]MBO0662615.1 MAPEG family protein [Jiella flava]MCD2471037.1 MAPEG family protein [Jiella flava]
MNTTGLAAVAIYAALNGGVLVWLTVQTGRVRARDKVMMGDGGNPRLIRAMRGHANAVEFIPITLITMTLAALLGAPALVLHVLGIMLTVGRVLHALHFTADDAPRWQRFSGTGLSLLAMAGAALAALIQGLMAI